MEWWAQGLGGRGRGISSAIHPQDRERLLEALLTPWVLGGSGGPRGSPPLPAAVQGRAAVVGAEPKAGGFCPTLPSSPALFSPGSTGGQGSGLTLSVPARAPRLVQPSILPSLAPSRASEEQLQPWKITLPPSLPLCSLLLEVLAGQPGQLYSPWPEENINPLGARGRRVIF